MTNDHQQRLAFIKRIASEHGWVAGTWSNETILWLLRLIAELEGERSPNRRAACGCRWNANLHGDTCPEHGAPAEREGEGALAPPECQHPKCIPAFDEAAAQSLNHLEVRNRWPRFCGVCPDCKEQVIAYASTAHYVLGDW